MEPTIDDAREQTQAQPRSVVDYPAAIPDDHPLKVMTLVWLSIPAFVGAALLTAIIYVAAAHPGDRLAGANLFVAFVPVFLISGITSGAAVLAVIDSRKTILNVFFMTLNGVWLLGCLSWFFLRRA